MRVRILVINGPRTIDLFWLHHDGKDVYCGPSKLNHKRSYHVSGKVHATSSDERSHEGWHQPLQELRGQFHLTTMNLGNANAFVSTQAPRHEYQSGKSDTLLVINARTIPNDIQACIAIGLLEPGNFSPLTPLTSTQLFGPQDEIT